MNAGALPATDPVVFARVDVAGLAVAVVFLALGTSFFVMSWRNSNGFADGCSGKIGVIVLFLLSLVVVTSALAYGACSFVFPR